MSQHRHYRSAESGTRPKKGQKDLSEIKQPPNLTACLRNKSKGHQRTHQGHTLSAIMSINNHPLPRSTVCRCALYQWMSGWMPGCSFIPCQRENRLNHTTWKQNYTAATWKELFLFWISRKGRRRRRRAGVWVLQLTGWPLKTPVNQHPPCVSALEFFSSSRKAALPEPVLSPLYTLEYNFSVTVSGVFYGF